MIKCIAIDDEPLALAQLESYIQKTPDWELVKACNNAVDALETLTAESIDVLFIDINMPDINGMDFVRSLTVKPMIIFTTAYMEYAVEGFQVDAMDYLLKPFGYKDFLRAVGKINRQKELLSLKSTVTVEKEADDYIFVRADYKTVRVRINDIDYIESLNEYVRIFIHNEKPVMTLLSLKNLEEKLPTGRFMRVHRSYIVNLQRVNEVSHNRIIMGKEYIPIGNNYKDAFLDFLKKSLVEK